MKNLIALIGLVALLFGSQAYAAGDEELCDLTGCTTDGKGIGFGSAGRITFFMDNGIIMNK